MKMQIRMMMLLFVVLFCQKDMAQNRIYTHVKIGGLYYNLYDNKTADIACGDPASYGRSDYTNESYYLPTKVSYKGTEYTIIGIDNFAFSSYNGTLGTGSPTKKIIFPNTIEKMGGGVFNLCNELHVVIYLPTKAPKTWTPKGRTYVPDVQSYLNTSFYSSHYFELKELIEFEKKEFEYSAQPPTTTWFNNLESEGYSAELSMPILKAEVGDYVVTIPVTFTGQKETFTVNVIYRYSIKPAKLYAKVKNVSREYGEDNPQFSISYSGFINGENESVITSTPTTSTTATKTSDVGDYPISISGGSANNYTFIYESGILSITKASLTAKVDDATKQYGMGNPTFTISYSGLKNEEKVPKWKDMLSFETSANEKSNVGEYIVTAKGIPINYNLSEIKYGILTITQAPLIIKANNAMRKYFEDEPSFNFFCTGFVNNDNVETLLKKPIFIIEANKNSPVGTYSIMPSGAEARNYSISYEPGELSITKRQLKVTSNATREYGEDNPKLSLKFDGFVNDEKENVITTLPTATTTATNTSPVGNYSINITGGEATNYCFDYVQGLLAVTKAPLSAKVNDAIKVYGSENPAFTIEYYGLRNNETAPAWTTKPTFLIDATQYSGVGIYRIKAVDGLPVNYDLGEITAGTLNITPAPLTIKANDAVRQYYSDDPTFSYTCNGFVNGENESVLVTTPKLSTTATHTSSVGTYKIKVGETSSPNYSISFINATLTITPRTLIASVGNYERPYSEENPQFEVKYDGFVGGEDINVLTNKAVASTSATKTSDVGTYTINVSGGSADNYKFSYSSGILSINKAEQSISWEQDLSIIGVGDQVELKAEASSGLPVTYTIDNESIAEIYIAGTKSYLDCKKKGEAQLMAVQEGNRNYYSSARIRKSIVIGDVSAVKTVEKSPIRILRTHSGISIIDTKVGDIIQVYTSDGVLVKSVKAKGNTTDIPLAKGHIYIIKVGGRRLKLNF